MDDKKIADKITLQGVGGHNELRMVNFGFSAAGPNNMAIVMVRATALGKFYVELKRAIEAEPTAFGLTAKDISGH